MKLTDRAWSGSGFDAFGNTFTVVIPTDMYCGDTFGAFHCLVTAVWNGCRGCGADACLHSVPLRCCVRVAARVQKPTLAAVSSRGTRRTYVRVADGIGWRDRVVE